MSANPMSTLRDDLAPVYGPGSSVENAGPSIAQMMQAGAPANSISKAQWRATRDALAAQLARYDQLAPGCRNCLFLDAGGWCAKFEAVPPAGFDGSDCDAWMWDGVPL